MDDAITYRDKIERQIAILEFLIGKLEEVSLMKATSLSNLEKSIAVTMIKLKNNLITEFEGNKINGVPATLIPTIAKGLCSEQTLYKELKEAEYKALSIKIDVHKAILNACQSLNKVLQ